MTTWTKSVAGQTEGELLTFGLDPVTVTWLTLAGLASGVAWGLICLMIF